MTNKLKGEVSFEANGELFTLQFTTNALCALEEHTGKSAIQVGRELSDENNVMLSLLRVVFWSGLIQHQEGITLSEAGDLLDSVDLKVIGPKIGEAFTAAFPDVKGEGSGKPKARKPRRK